MNKTLANAREWKPGTPKLQAVNELFADLNFTPLWVDEVGFYTSQLFQNPSVRTANYTY